jgi:hypothetical protein
MLTVGAFIHEHHSLVRPTGFCSKIDATESRVKQTAAAEMKCMLQLVLHSMYHVRLLSSNSCA